MKTDSVVRIRPNLKIFSGVPSLVAFFCVFYVFLLFIMFGSNFVPMQGIPVELPQAASRATYGARSLIVTIDSKSNIYFNDVLTDNPEVLRRRLNDVLSVRRGKERERLVVRVDAGAKAETLFRLMSIAEELNLNALLMTADPAKSAKTSFAEPER